MRMPGLAVRVSGRVNLYKDAIQVSISDLARANGLDLTVFLPASRRPREDMLAELRVCVGALAEPWGMLTAYLLLEGATAERYAAEVIKQIVTVAWPPDVFVNVNFPDLPAASVRGIHVVPQGRRKPAGSIEERIDPRGNPYYWIGLNREVDPVLEETDVAAVRDGYVSVTPLNVDMSYGPLVEALRKAFA